MHRRLHEYIKKTRGVGHTRLQLDGTLNANYPFIIVGVDKSHANDLKRKLGNNHFASPIALNSEEAFRGVREPAIIDNSVFTIVCDEFIKEIRDGREDMEKLNSKINEIENIPFLFRIFKSVYKQKINNIRNKS